jgi:hypothetical protein
MRVIMLSDERIRQIAESVSGTRYTAVEEIMTGIRAALAEAAQAEPEEKLDFEKLESLGWQIAICAMCGTHASAIKPAQSVPVVERNQCDGCNRGLQVCDDGLHREPSGHPVMACTRNKYTRSIPATELERLRKDAERYRWLRDGEKSAGTGMTDEAIDAHITKERQS